MTFLGNALMVLGVPMLLFGIVPGVLMIVAGFLIKKGFE